MPGSSKIKEKCSHCESCLTCEMVRVGKALKESVNKFIDIHNSTSDVVFSNQLIYQECRKSIPLIHEFEKIMREVGIK